MVATPYLRFVKTVMISYPLVHFSLSSELTFVAVEHPELDDINAPMRERRYLICDGEMQTTREKSRSG